MGNSGMWDADPARRAIKVWMRDVLLEKGWCAADWARHAGTSATNITRFLQPEHNVMLSTRTLAKLADAAGSQPSLVPRSASRHQPEYAGRWA